jgi:hypothetical protein
MAESGVPQGTERPQNSGQNLSCVNLEDCGVIIVCVGPMFFWFSLINMHWHPQEHVFIYFVVVDILLVLFQ